MQKPDGYVEVTIWMKEEIRDLLTEMSQEVCPDCGEKHCFAERGGQLVERGVEMASAKAELRSYVLSLLEDVRGHEREIHQPTWFRPTTWN